MPKIHMRMNRPFAPEVQITAEGVTPCLQRSIHINKLTHTDGQVQGKPDEQEDGPNQEEEPASSKGKMGIFPEDGAKNAVKLLRWRTIDVSITPER
jgi:hypothetical protein